MIDDITINIIASIATVLIAVPIFQLIKKIVQYLFDISIINEVNITVSDPVGAQENVIIDNKDGITTEQLKLIFKTKKKLHEINKLKSEMDFLLNQISKLKQNKEAIKNLRKVTKEFKIVYDIKGKDGSIIKGNESILAKVDSNG